MSLSFGACRPDVSLQQEVWSPDSTRVARFWQLAGGGAAGYVYGFVDVRPRDAPFDPFASDYAFQNSGREITMIWRNNDHLHIRHPGWDHTGRRCPNVRGVRFTYEALAEPDTAWSKSTHSDFAYRRRMEAYEARRGEPPIVHDPPDSTCAWANSGRDQRVDAR